MRHPSRFSFLLSVTAALLALLSSGVRAAEPAPPASAAPDGMAMLSGVGEAWRQGNFRGRILYVRGNRMDSIQIVHAWIDGAERERISHLDDTASEIIRRGDETIVVHPDARITQFDIAGASTPFPALTLPAAEIERVYEVRATGTSRVSGRTADRLEIHPRDPFRYGYRFWIDRESRLPLRYEIAGRKGQPIESAEFVELETGIRVPREMFQPPAGAQSRTRSVRRVTETAGLPMPPVAPSWLPPGFRVTGSDAQQVEGADSPMVTVTYSDGLASFSLFHEPAGADTQPAARQVGPTVAVSGVLDAGAAGRYRVTLVGEIPAGTAVKIIEGVRLVPPAQNPGKKP